MADDTVNDLLGRLDSHNCPLGPVASWPVELRQAMSLFLPAAAQIVLFWGPEYVSIYNDAYAAAIGNKHPGAFGRPAAESWRALWDDVEPLLQRVWRTGETYQAKDRPFHLERGDGGETTYFDVSYSAAPDADGNVVGILCIVAETTARVRAERNLEAEVAARTQERDTVWKVSQDLLVVAGLDGVIRSVNPAWRRTLGWRPDELVGRSSEWLEHPDDVSRTRNEMEALATGRLTHGFENRLRTRDGRYRTFAWTGVPIEGAIYSVARDVTIERERQAELEDTQERLRQAQKMETIGQLTGGVAHDFNNLLQVVTGNLDILVRKLPEDQARMRRAADNALDGARRAAILTRRLLAFARRQPLSPKRLNPNRMVLNMSDLLHRTLGETIEVQANLARDVWSVEVDANELENAILNLALNARDALPSGGSLTIETANAHLSPEEVRTHGDVSPGDYVMLTVSDTGVGMTKEVAARVFEPFFTTKEVGKGTGLGLSMVYGFVMQSGGHVRLQTEVGQGTSVSIFLPRLEGAELIDEEEEAPAALAMESTREETVLVCEDDNDVRAYSVDALRELGYRVIEAHDGPSAMRLLERKDGRVDLLFTDVVLPSGLTGADVAQEARRIRPDLKILFTTGYARDAIVHHGRLDPGVELITKPFSYADLAARVRAILDA